MTIRSKSRRELSRVMRRVRSLGARVTRFAQTRATLLPGFDREFYLRQYPDVAEAGADPLEHFLRHGRAEGRGSSRITTSRAGRVGALLRYAKARVLLGFDREFYVIQYPDVAEAGADPLDHYLRHGRQEGRAPSRKALATTILEVRPTDLESDPLRLGDLCDPHHDEPGPKLSDGAFLVTVLTPAFNTDPRYIRELYQALVNQRYSNWEWVVVDDGSSRTHSIAIWRDLARRDPRVRFFANPVNLGISGASNIEGLPRARNARRFSRPRRSRVLDAFHAVYEAWKQNPNTQLFYTDECKLLPDGRVSEPWPKPDWSPAYLENTMCVAHLSVYELNFLRQLG